MDDDGFDDAALWAVIDSAAACYTSSTNSATAIGNLKLRKRSPALRHIPHLKSPQLQNHSPSSSPSPSLSKSRVSDDYNYPQKMSKYNEITSPNLQLVTRSPFNSSPKFNVSSPIACDENNKENSSPRHCLAGQFPTVSLFKDFQDAAMSILEKSDYIVISGNPFIKKSGWRKIAFYFNVSFEIRDKTIEFDENHNVRRAEFVVRAYMQGGRFSDGWGSCERLEKKFLKPNNDIPSTAETRAKNRACQDLLGIGQYRPGVSHKHSSG